MPIRTRAHRTVAIDDDLSTTMDMNESMTIRRQLEGLESMYSELHYS